MWAHNLTLILPVPKHCYHSFEYPIGSISLIKSLLVTFKINIHWHADTAWHSSVPIPNHSYYALQYSHWLNSPDNSEIHFISSGKCLVHDKSAMILVKEFRTPTLQQCFKDQMAWIALQRDECCALFIHMSRAWPARRSLTWPDFSSHNFTRSHFL